MRVIIPMRVSTPLNGSHGHWRTQAAKRKKERLAVAHVLRCHAPLPALPVVVTMTRHAPRSLDDDNLTSALKSVRDEVAKALGCGDSAKDPILWRYAQCKGAYAVAIDIHPWRVEE